MKRLMMLVIGFGLLVPACKDSKPAGDVDPETKVSQEPTSEVTDSITSLVVFYGAGNGHERADILETHHLLRLPKSKAEEEEFEKIARTHRGAGCVAYINKIDMSDMDHPGMKFLGLEQNFARSTDEVVNMCWTAVISAKYKYALYSGKTDEAEAVLADYRSRFPHLQEYIAEIKSMEAEGRNSNWFLKRAGMIDIPDDKLVSVNR